ncbi:HAMP domain-containing protein [Sphingomonas gilva]|uniref:non-specific serine/threonine protein kinase n=1 Tax=Sphingomonas gilva TaxID=2305907 RepID=A0A396RTH7_9SPHN|nr:protein kinase [Sphingomonas gilva]RHW16951.1 HAMP domain-containing protein [Sphingomonas gilva]
MERIGRYEIDARIGEGAMADVYRAHDPDIARAVAIKVLKPEFRRDPDIVRRFLREAQAAGMLSHANIATIFDVGETGGLAYIAMECVEGRGLDELMKDGRFPAERALKIARQLADALAYAHRNGIVHRDIKPSNILLADANTPKLLDFGIARFGQEAATERAALATQVGQVIGTPRYMSPEQAMGLPVDARSDLFSLGVVLYEMVTGKTAFTATGLATLAIQIAQADPAPIERSVRDCPKGLKFIIEKLLAKKPEARFQSGDELRDALQRELDAITADEPVKRRGLALKVKLPLILGAATAGALALSTSMVLDRQSETLERMTLTSGSSITGFVTSNAAVYAASNAGLPPEMQDWVPLQAFVATAVRNENVARLVVTDDRGVIRAASDPRLQGKRYVAPGGETKVGNATRTAQGYRFVRPITYAGAEFGKVDLLLKRDELDAAIANTRMLLIALAVVVMGIVLAIGLASAQMISRPVRRLRRALDDAAKGDLAFRISHRRRDELGGLMDAFNRMAAAIEPRLDREEDAAALLHTRISTAAPAPTPAPRATTFGKRAA